MPKTRHLSRSSRPLTSTHSDIRSVTVWFQNKRQTDRRIHRQLSEPATVQLTPSSPMPLPPSSPFSDASGNTIHTVRERTRTLSGNSSASALSATSSIQSRKRDREREADAVRALARQVRHRPSRTISLDDIAARTERPALLPRTPPQLQCIPSSSSSPTRPVTPEPDLKADVAEGRRAALWQNMPSSPAEPIQRSERNLVRYASRRITLEYACAREMMGDKEREQTKVSRLHGEKDSRSKDKKHRKAHGQRKEKRRVAAPRPQTRQAREEEEEVLDIPVADWDMQGDTDTEGVLSEAPMTPSSSFDLSGLSMQDPAKAKAPANLQKEAAVTMQFELARPAHDEDMMDAAYVLFNLSQRR